MEVESVLDVFLIIIAVVVGLVGIMILDLILEAGQHLGPPIIDLMNAFAKFQIGRDRGS